jgi:glycosyltransferase involved in cell wall biosynthesis
MAQYLPVGFPGLKLLHEHNAEYLIWQREADAARNPATRLALARECTRVRTYEAAILPRFDFVFPVSRADADALIELGAAADKVQILPNLPDARLFSSPELAFDESEKLLLFIGTLSWKPNIDSAVRLLTRIFPVVQSRLPETRLAIAGAGAPASLQALAGRSPGVEFVAEVSDVEALYRRARVFVEATQSGGGTKLKVLNALARGLPVVASPEGAAGLEVSPGLHLSVAPDDASFVDAIVRLLTDEATWRSQSEAGRTLTREKYLAEAAFEPLRQALSGIPGR